MDNPNAVDHVRNTVLFAGKCGKSAFGTVGGVCSRVAHFFGVYYHVLGYRGGQLGHRDVTPVQRDLRKLQLEYWAENRNVCIDESLYLS